MASFYIGNLLWMLIVLVNWRRILYKRWLFLLKILLRQPNSGPDRTLLGINEIGLGPVEVRIQA